MIDRIMAVLAALLVVSSVMLVIAFDWRLGIAGAAFLLAYAIIDQLPPACR